MTIVVFLSIVSVIAALVLSRRKAQEPIKESLAPNHHAMSSAGTMAITTIEYLTIGEPKKYEWKFKADGTGKSSHLADLSTVTCTCEEFVSRRRNFNPKDIRRLCSHLVKAYDKPGVWPEQEEIVNAMLRTGPSSGCCWTHDRLHKGQLTSGEAIYFGTRDGKKWVDVYTRKRRKGDSNGKYSGAYDKFGFNQEEGKWSYVDGPPAAKEIRLLISRIS